MKTAAIVIAIFVFLFQFVPNDQPRQNVILIGWDGAQRNHVRECLQRGELPNLKRLSEEGRLVDIDIRGVTDTKAGWAQILTGYDPEITGVYSNSKYGPIPKGLSVFERLEGHFRKDNIFTAAIIGKKGNIDADGPRRVKEKNVREPQRANRLRRQASLVVEGGVRYFLIPAKPYYYSKEGIDLFLNGLKLNETVANKTIDVLDTMKSDQRFFFFVHFAEVDHQGHLHGENSPEYADALKSSDRWTGAIIQRLKDRGFYDRTRIYVTADHGFDEGERQHRNAPYVFLGTNDPDVVRGGDRADIAPTILEQYGINLKDIQPPLSGSTLTKR